jgi:hypothetical protein
LLFAACKSEKPAGGGGGGGAPVPTFAITVPDTGNGELHVLPLTGVAGETVTVTWTPNPSYTLGSLTIVGTGGEAEIEPEYLDGYAAFTMPSYNVTITPEFEQWHAIESVFAADQGTVLLSAPSADTGVSVSVTITPTAPFFLKGITVAETGGSRTVTPVQQTTNVYTFNMPDYDVTVTVEFAQPLVQNIVNNDPTHPPHLTAEGSASYTVTTSNISGAQTPTILWYSNAAGTDQLGSAPAGVNPVIGAANFSSGSTTVSLTTTGQGKAGTYYFRLVIDGAKSSSVGTLS